MKPLLVAITMLLLSCNTTEGQVSAPKAHDHQITDPSSVHGMLVFGTEEIYLSHLPMFHNPHDYQVILKTKLVKSGVDVHDLYARDRARSGAELYTIVPEPFVLPELFPPPGTIPARRSFRATLFRGHFERGGSPLVANLTVEVENVILARKLIDETDANSMSYFVFGNEIELFAAHWIQAKPDFDQILSVRILEGILTPEQAEKARLGSTLQLTIDNSAENALGESSGVTGTLVMPGESVDVEFDVLKSEYLEIDELSF